MLAGIAKPKPFYDFLQSENDFVLTFPDHHHFSEGDILNIKNQANDKIIVTTEKDFVRLMAYDFGGKLYYLPIKSRLISGQDLFDATILKAVQL